MTTQSLSKQGTLASFLILLFTVSKIFKCLKEHNAAVQTCTNMAVSGISNDKDNQEKCSFFDQLLLIKNNCNWLRIPLQNFKLSSHTLIPTCFFLMRCRKELAFGNGENSVIFSTSTIITLNMTL